RREAGLRAVRREAGLRAVRREAGLRAVRREAGMRAVRREAGMRAVRRELRMRVRRQPATHHRGVLMAGPDAAEGPEQAHHARLAGALLDRAVTAVARA